MTALQLGRTPVRASGGRWLHVERAADLRQIEPLDGALLPGLPTLLMDRDASVLDRSIEARPGDAQLADSLARANHRFLLTHVPSVADVPIVPLVPDGVQ